MHGSTWRLKDYEYLHSFSKGLKATTILHVTSESGSGFYLMPSDIATDVEEIAEGTHGPLRNVVYIACGQDGWLHVGHELYEPTLVTKGRLKDEYAELQLLVEGGAEGVLQHLDRVEELLGLLNEPYYRMLRDEEDDHEPL